jgi:hypothetical protein
VQFVGYKTCWEQLVSHVFMRVFQACFCLIQSYLFVSNTVFEYKVCIKHCILVLGLCQTLYFSIGFVSNTIFVYWVCVKILRNTTQVIVRHRICLQTDGRTDGRTDGWTWWNQYPPYNFVAVGINSVWCKPNTKIQCLTQTQY